MNEPRTRGRDQDAVPQQTAKGAHERWAIRTLSASDRATGGFASEVVWVGTDNQQADTRWVEVGVTHGWQGQNLFTFYTAHQSAGGYGEHLIPGAPAPQVDFAWTFAAYWTASGIYRAEITQNGSVYHSYAWSTHNPSTVDYSGGLESTCGTSRVDRTYVTVNQFYRSSDLTWVSTNNGTLSDQASVGGIGWCSIPLRFRYFLNSVLNPTICA